ncbi:hypothetical protein CPB86DRAFT_315699 [Serendipita vermifera]|nr:hypothetical protein CPB86DRAFT_315699 [Serendipita vermifera]
MLNQLYLRQYRNKLAKNWFDVGGLVISWSGFIAASSVATSRISGRLHDCEANKRCPLLSPPVLVSLSWATVVPITLLLFPTFIIVLRKGSWGDFHFDTWGRRLFTSNLKDPENWGRRGQRNRDRTLVETTGAVSLAETAVVRN